MTTEPQSAQATCHYHPNQPAFVRCGACGKALCAECVYHGPVGTRCVECLFGIEIKPVSRLRRVAAGAAALAIALALGALFGYTGWLNWLTGIVIGLATGQVARSIVKSIAAPTVQAAAGIAAAIGAYGGAIVSHMRILAQAGAPISLATAAAHIGVGDWGVAGLVAAGVAVYWVWRG